MRKRFLQSIASLTYRAPWLTLAGVCMVTGWAGYVANHNLPENMRTDWTQFLPTDLASVRTYMETKKDFDSFHTLIAVFESSSPGKEAALKEAADQFADAIQDPGYILSTEHKVSMAAYGPDPAGSDERLVNLLTEKDWESIQEKLKPDSIDRMLTLLLASQLVPEPNRPRPLLLQDPFDINSITSKRLLHSRGPIDISLRDGYIMSQDGRYLLMIIRPQRPATDHRFSRRLMEFLDDARVGVLQGVSASRGVDIQIGFVGAHVEAYSADQQIRKDLGATFTVSFVGVILLFLLAFRRPIAIVFVSLPLAAGIIWALGLTVVLVGHLTTITISIAAMLVGLCIDFSVHIYSRFAEEMARGAGTRLAIEKSIVQTGEGIMTGALTTAAAFYGLMLTSFPGFQELGAIAGTGVLCCLAAVYLCLPSLMLIEARLWGKRARPVRPASFGLGSLATGVLGYPRAALIVGVAVTAYFAYFAPRVEFTRDWSYLLETPEDYIKLKSRVMSQFQLPGSQVVAVVSGNTLQEALEANDRLYSNLEAARENYPALLSYDSIRTLLPSLRSQEESRRRIRDLDIGALEKRLKACAARVGLADAVVEPCAARLARLREYAATAPYADLHNAGPSDMTVREVQRYATKTRPQNDANASARYRIITHIYPREGGWLPSPPKAFFADISQGIKDIEFTGDSLPLAEAIDRNLVPGLARAIWLVALAVFVLLYLHFHNIRLALFGMLPVICSLLWTLGFMSLADLRFSFINVIVVPMIIGLATDNGIHILQRYFEAGDYDVEAAMRHTGRAVVISSLTVMVAFGALSLAHFQGLREIGLLAIIGVGFALVSTLTLMPTLLSLTGARLNLLDAVGRDKGVEREARED